MNRNLKYTTLVFFVLILFRQVIVDAQTLTVGSGTTVNITSNAYYDAIIVQNNGVLNVIAPAILTVGVTGTLASTSVVTFNGGNPGSTFLLSSGATMIVNGQLENKNNSPNVQINGVLTVNGNVDGGGTGSVIFGSGTLTATGSIITSTTGVIFGTQSDCGSGPCNGNNLCSSPPFSTTNTILSSSLDYCTTINTTSILNASTITSATYQWQSSAAVGGPYANTVGGSGSTAQDYTPSTNIASTIYFRRNVTVSGCTQASNILTVTVGKAPIIIVQPSTTQTVCVGNIAIFNVLATGSNLGYQWRKNTTNIIGATSATYTISSVAVGDAATNYNCLVTSSCVAPNIATTSNASLVVTNTSVPTVTATSSASTCTGSGISLTGTKSGGTGTLVSVWTGPNSYASATTLSPTVTASATAAMGGTYIHTVTDANGCKASASTAIAILPTGQWLGATNANWNTGINWCGGVPSSTVDVLIPSGTPFPLIINAPSAIVRNLTINSGASLILTNNIPLNLYGNFANSGTFTDNGGTVSFLGSTSQDVTNMATAKNVTVNNAAGVVLNSNITVSGLLTLTSGTLNSSGQLTVNLTTGNIDKTGTGSITGNITLVRNASELGAGWHYLGSPLFGTTFNDLNDNVILTTSNFYSYHEGDGNSNIGYRWKGLLSAPLNLPLTTPMAGPIFTGAPSSLMAGYALKFPTATAIDIKGSYTHGAAVSYSTGAMSYTNGGVISANGWQLIANPFPSYIDWNSASVNISNVEAGIAYQNNSAGGTATYLPATTTPSFPEVSTNGGSPFIPAMQALWVQVKSVGNGVITINNNARIINPSLAGYPSAPSFYRSARTTAQCFKLVATNSMGSDETCLRFGKGATTKFDSNIDMSKFGNDDGYPSLYTVTDTVEYAVNSLPELPNVKEVNLSLYAPQSGNYTISIKDLLNMEDYSSVNLYDKLINRSQNLMQNDTYSFEANKGDAENRFVLTFQLEILTNTQTMAFGNTVDMFSNSEGMVSLRVNNSTSGKANVMVINILGQDVYEEVSVDIKSGRADIKINNIGSGVYIVKAIIDGRSYSKEVVIMK